MSQFTLGIWMMFLMILGGTPPQETCSLVIRVDEPEAARGMIRLGIYDNAAAFAAQKGAMLDKNIPVVESLQPGVTITGLAPGFYAIGGYHDVNDNDKLDTNLLGIPKEPYGFSRNPKAKWSAPTFEETVIELKPGVNEVRVAMRTWGKR